MDLNLFHEKIHKKYLILVEDSIESMVNHLSGRSFINGLPLPLYNRKWIQNQFGLNNTKMVSYYNFYLTVLIGEKRLYNRETNNTAV